MTGFCGCGCYLGSEYGEIRLPFYKDTLKSFLSDNSRARSPHMLSNDTTRGKIDTFPRMLRITKGGLSL